MSHGKGFWVFDHTGACVGCCDGAANAVAQAKRYAEAFGTFADTVSRYGKRRKRFYADGRVQTVKMAKRT